jgi:hypothetical protein
MTKARTRKPQASAPEPEPCRDPTSAEVRRIEKAKQRFRSREPAPIVLANAAARCPVHTDLDGYGYHLCDTFGTGSGALTNVLLTQICRAKAPQGNFTEDDVNAALAAVHGIAPQDEAEAMLAAQMVAVHTAAMQMLRQVAASQTISQQDSNGNLATKLLRTYSAQMEALARYRRRGEQTVRVEHVHVEPGAQAIVGTVTHYQGGGGDAGNSERPHAQEPGPQMLGIHALPEMRSADAVGESLPVTGREGEDPLPDAWRRKGQRGA